jgi:hypothetical protein
MHKQKHSKMMLSVGGKKNRKAEALGQVRTAITVAADELDFTPIDRTL